MPPQLTLRIHFTKSPKRDNIDNCVYGCQEKININITIQQCSMLQSRYRAHAQTGNPLLYCTESLKHDDIELFGL